MIIKRGINIFTYYLTHVYYYSAQQVPVTLLPHQVTFQLLPQLPAPLLHILPVLLVIERERDIIILKCLGCSMVMFLAEVFSTKTCYTFKFKSMQLKYFSFSVKARKLDLLSSITCLV